MSTYDMSRFQKCRKTLLRDIVLLAVSTSILGYAVAVGYFTNAIGGFLFILAFVAVILVVATTENIFLELDKLSST